MSEPEKKKKIGDAKHILKQKQIWILVAIGAISFLNSHTLRNWLPSILEIKGFNPQSAGYAASIMMTTGILGGVTIPRLSSSKRSNKQILAVLLLLSGISIISIGSGNGLILFGGISLIGFLTSGLTPILMVILMEMKDVGSRWMGTVGGLFFSVGEIGGFFGPFLMGYLRDLTGSFTFGILVLAIINFVSILALKPLKTDT
jgi:cyanate permease